MPSICSKCPVEQHCDSSCCALSTYDLSLTVCSFGLGWRAVVGATLMIQESEKLSFESRISTVSVSLRLWCAFETLC